MILGGLTVGFEMGVSGESVSRNVSRRGDGGDDEHTEVAEVRSPSDVRDVRVEALEKRDVSLSGSNRSRSGERLVEEADIAAELTLLARTPVVRGIMGSFSRGETGVIAGDSIVDDVADAARERRFRSLGIGEADLCRGITGDTLSLLFSLNREGSRWTRYRWLGIWLSLFCTCSSTS